MINSESRTREWIESLHKQYSYIKDASLLEKTIRAFSLLESLVRSGCPFIFKGGTALMLHLGSSRRLSIDIDIVCKPGTNVWDYLERYAGKLAYLVRLMELGINEVSHYTMEADSALAEILIENQALNKLNRIKKINTEAFFYCHQLEQLL